MKLILEFESTVRGPISFEYKDDGSNMITINRQVRSTHLGYMWVPVARIHIDDLLSLLENRANQNNNEQDKQ